MNFPTWVPKPISAYIQLKVEGDARDPYGLLKSMQSLKDGGEDTTQLETDISCLSRLGGIDDERMIDAYKVLAGEFNQDEQWRGFVAATYAANIDYGRIRERLRSAQDLAAAVANKADELAILLGKAGSAHSNWPDELYSMQALLQGTNGSDLLWPGLKKNLLNPVDNEQRHSFHYIWNIAPSVRECLLTMVKAAREFKPQEFGMIGAAVSNRQANAKTEYIRAFAAALRKREIVISANVQKAMAIAANVALNDENVDVSFKDVKQALAQNGITHGK